MKELSIDEKAKAYDEAIKRAREWYNELEPDSYTCVVESIFPEFKESEDKKIRKKIIALVNAYGQGMYKDEMLAWLEKKGEQNPYSGVSFKYNGHTWGMCARDNGVEILVDGEIKERVFLGSKPQGKSALEAINEEKVDNANKVEPKFKVGDWITNGVYTCKIVEVIDNSYKYTFPEGASYFGVIDDIDKEYRLWTIDDAKTGDVLAFDNSQIILVKESYNSTWGWRLSCWCHLLDGEFEVIEYHIKTEGLHPATNKQRDLLFQKMKEAGYKWNAEKLELKKIKPEFWSDDDNKRFNGFKIALGGVQMADDFYNIPNAYHIFATEKQAKSALAMARISQIIDNDIENFGGVVTDEEWKNNEWKYVIYRDFCSINTTFVIHNYYFLAFHTSKQRDLFLEKYPQLVKDYLMIPEE
jgi:hypothetical protein